MHVSDAATPTVGVGVESTPIGGCKNEVQRMHRSAGYLWINRKRSPLAMQLSKDSGTNTTQVEAGRLLVSGWLL
jgi:hypothetical protein